MKKSILFFVTLFIITSTLSISANAGSRSANPLGLSASIMSGSFYIGSLNYNLADFFRVSAGYGQKKYSIFTSNATVSVVVLGAKFFIPTWSFSPFVGADYLMGKSTITFEGETYTASATGVSPTVGVDFQGLGGLNLGVIIYLDTASSAGVYAGWYF